MCDIEEINKHLWIESQKVGFSIGIERATDEWLRLHSTGWLKYNKPGKYTLLLLCRPNDFPHLKGCLPRAS